MVLKPEFKGRLVFGSAESMGRKAAKEETNHQPHQKGHGEHSAEPLVPFSPLGSLPRIF